MSHWWPLLKEVPGINVPETRLTTFDGDTKDFFDWYEGRGRTETLQAFLERLQDLGQEVGYPCFLRTGHTSGKHGWDNCCHVPSLSVLPKHVCAIFEFGEMAQVEGLPVNVWAVRELLLTEPYFHIKRFGNMPLCRERRYFIENGKVVSHVPYWPYEAIGGSNEDDDGPYRQWCQRDLPANWRELLTQANAEDEAEVALLTDLSERVSERIEGAWSLDWLWTAHGWYAIDMAEAHKSWACPESLRRSDR